jgi:outer membrane protein OmpA-like peptidoglycan-associated protein/tetratricopeptide (TPR) repeat protein
MRKKALLLLVVSIIILPHISYSQYVLKEADEQYDKFNHSQAIDLYEKAYKKKKSKHAIERLAECYRLTHNYKQAESWYGKLSEMPGADPESVFYYAEALRNNSKYAEARQQYLTYAGLNKNISAEQVSFWRASCDSALKWLKNPQKTQLKGRNDLNTPSSDWGAVPYQDGIVFSSDRKWDGSVAQSRPFLKFDSRYTVNRDIYGLTGKSYLKLFYSKGEDLKVFPIKFDNEQYHIGAATFTKDGSELYFSVTRKLTKEELNKAKSAGKVSIGVEIYSSKLENGSWTKPEPFPLNNITKWNVGDPYITPDGKKLYFVSDQPGGTGGTDIYVCWRQDGKWGDAINLEQVNTKGNERTPFISADSSFYFATDGLPGMGGLDLFKAAIIKTGLGTPVNMGYPVNSPQDDLAYFAVSLKDAYITSDREGGQGSDDVYSLHNAEETNLVIEGVVRDKKTGLPVADALVTLTDTKTNAMLKAQTDANGHYRFNVDSAAYNLTVEKTNYRAVTDPLSGTDRSGGNSIKKNILLEPISLNEPIKIDNIYYDFDKWNIRADATPELDKLVKILKDNPTLWVEINSHTDSRGDNAYNLKLSQRRAESVVKYLISKGINENHLEAVGYGESKLLNHCADGHDCSDADHHVNRRTEFVIVEK